MFFGIATFFEILVVLGLLGIGIYQFLCRVDGWLDQSSGTNSVNWDGMHEQID